MANVFVLVRVGGRSGDKHRNSLLIKERERFVEEDGSLGLALYPVP